MYALSPALIFPHFGLKYRPSQHAVKSLGLGRRMIYLLCRNLTFRELWSVALFAAATHILFPASPRRVQLGLEFKSSRPRPNPSQSGNCKSPMLALLHCGITSHFRKSQRRHPRGSSRSYCRLLPPRPIAKLLEESKITGAGDGNRTEHPSNSR
jgi:hypothetical protein